MKTIFICFLAVTLFISPKEYFSNVNPYSRNETFTVITSDDVSVTNTYLNDGNHNYGVRYTLTNNTGDAKNVSWSFTERECENVQSSAGFSGVQYLIGYGQAQIVTFTQIDPNKKWSVGAPSISW